MAITKKDLTQHEAIYTKKWAQSATKADVQAGVSQANGLTTTKANIVDRSGIDVTSSSVTRS